MCNKMECKIVVFLYFLFVTVKTGELIDVALDSAWRQDVGWVITCSWKLIPNDTLLSVRLYENDSPFMIYRPEVDGVSRNAVYERPDITMLSECTKRIPRGVTGTCVVTIELQQPQTKDFTMGCEIIGERPKFMMQKETIRVSAFVPPTDAMVKVELTNNESGRVMLNCTSSGLPAPQIVWNIGDQIVPSDFSDKFWNATSKLWHVWSVVSYDNSAEHTALCTPGINRDGQIKIGKPATYSSAAKLKVTAKAEEIIDVGLDSVWRQDLGWVITCSWNLIPNDTLQSVRLYENDRQFMIYRPEVDGVSRSAVFRRPDITMLPECTKRVPRGVTGTCVVTIELQQPQTRDFTMGCEVSGERPKFMMQKETIRVSAFVPPTDAIVEVELTNNQSGRVMLNCTSSGLPAPQIEWNIGDQIVPSDFSGKFWNATSKLWHVWSVVSYDNSDAHTALCTPGINRDGQMKIGIPATYSSAAKLKDLRSLVYPISLLLLR